MDKKKIQFFRSVLRVLERELGFQTDSESQCCGVSLGQCHILMELSEKKETTIKELAEIFGLDKSSLSRTVDKMVEAEMLNRMESKEDRRYMSLSLTKKGAAAAENINKICNDYYGKLFELIPKEKHSSIMESLSLLSDALYHLRKQNKGTPKGCCCN